MNSKFKELSFDVVLPSHLLVNPNLEPQAKLFYGLIRNLTKMEGYCFARNSYLGDLMGVTQRTVSSWLVSLENEGYITRVHEFDGFNDIRKIFISDEFKNPLRKEKIVPPPREKCPTGKKKPSHIKGDIGKGIYENNNSEPKECQENVVVFSKESFEKAAKNCGIEEERIEKAWKIWHLKSDKSKAAIRDPVAWLIDCARKNYRVSESVVEGNFRFLKEFERLAEHRGKSNIIQANEREGYIIFTDCPNVSYSIKDRNFATEVANQMKLRNIWRN